MTRYPIAAFGSALLLALATTASQAQIAASIYTPENVLPNDPFGDLLIDPANVDVANIGTFLTGLTPEVRLELQQRCVVIAANAAMYDTASATLCQAVLAAATPPA